jgi:iron complex transport system ATP-binding protein
MMIELRHVSCGYGENIVLGDITVKINEGEFVGVIGPNGSGKTTLIRVATKVIKPTAGEVLLEGRDLSAMGYRQLATRVAVVGTIDRNMDMRTEDLVLLGRIPLRERYRLLDGKTDVDAARQAMRVTGLLHLKDRPVSTLSSGERQLAFVARALAQEPKLLFLDEPTSHLDIRHQIGLLDLVAKLNREKRLTIITILHDLNLASQYCARLLLLDRGTLHSDGPPESVLTRETIEKVYRTPVVILNGPSSSKPFIRPVSREGGLESD